MTQQNQISFQLNMPGQPFVIPNVGLQANNASSLVMGYSISGGPTTMVLSVEGLTNSNGNEGVLDSYSGTANTSRTVNLAALYDSFQISGVWTGGLNVTVSVSFSTTGAGAAFSSVQDLPNIHTQ